MGNVYFALMHKNQNGMLSLVKTRVGLLRLVRELNRLGFYQFKGKERKEQAVVKKVINEVSGSFCNNVKFL